MEEKDELQFLIESKDFEKLTATERNRVIAEITEEEFRSRRKLILNVQSFLQAGVKKSKPSKDIQRNVLAVMRAKKEQTGWNRIVKYRMPIYIPAAAIILVLLMIPFFRNEESSSSEEQVATKQEAKPKIIYKTKTIEKEVPKIVEVEKVKYVTVIKMVPTISVDQITYDMDKKESDYISDPGLTYTPEQMEAQVNTVGKSNAVFSELNQFVSVGR